MAAWVADRMRCEIPLFGDCPLCDTVEKVEN
jgi:hypothetical protein